MAFELRPTESLPDLVARIAAASDEDLEDAVTRYDGFQTWTSRVNLMKNELRKRQKSVVWKLSTEARVIAWSALFLTALQLVLQFLEMRR